MVIPSATYRLQFNKDFTFRQALQITGYLHTLGISTVYASPILQAYPGSLHGYDVTGFGQINPAIGTRADLEALIKDLQEKGISWIQDIVPNHMSFSAENPMILDVWKRGRGNWNKPSDGQSGGNYAPAADAGRCAAKVRHSYPNLCAKPHYHHYAIDGATCAGRFNFSIHWRHAKNE